MEHIGFATIKLLILPFYKYWFIIVYILLFILSPILNAGIESLNRVQSVFLTVFFTAFFCCLGFVSEATFISLNDGYSLMFAMYLYFLGRMMNKWKLLKRSQGKQVFYWIASSMITVVGCAVLIYLKKSQFAWKMFSYNQLFVVLAAVNFVWIFLNLPEKGDGGKCQRIAKHILPIYYIHTCTVFSYYRNLPLKWVSINLEFALQIPALIVYAILIFAMCASIDELKMKMIGKVESKSVNKMVSNIRRMALYIKTEGEIMNTTLLIMAAGIGSRFGTGIKQLELVDDTNHIIMDYSIHDAIEAGFNHVVFIIRKDIEKEFKEVIGDRIASICSAHNVTVDYAFQDINDIPGELPEGRTKPWGTGQAVLAAKNVIDTPCIVINADDYYGKEGFKAVHEYLVNGGESCMAGFVLKNTLSDNGGVTRGICKMDENGNLTEVVETKNIVKTTAGAEADGVVVDVNSLVSMNMWGLTPDFLDVLEEGFNEFFEKEVPGNPLKAEYLIPIFIGELLEQGKMSVKVLKTNDTWYGMTYHEDVAAVKDSFKKMLENGVYKADLFADL